MRNYRIMTEKEEKACKKFTGYTVDRIICKQKIDLQMIQYYLDNEDKYDKNDVYNLFQEVYMANLVLKRRLQYAKEK